MHLEGMSASKLILSFFLFSCFFISFASSSSLNTTKKCSVEQTLALILFKQNLSSITFSIDYPCQDWLGYDYYPIMMTWNMSTDCCNWGGITCDHFTGDVIGIDLSCGMLRGTIHPNTTLFHLPHLQRLNLAYNDFTSSQLPREISMLSNSLTHLNISECGFTGEISSEISMLPKLVSLDLSWNFLQIQPSWMDNLLQNSTFLRDLSLASVDVGWVLPNYLNTTSLMLLDLRDTGLQGTLPDNIFSLQYLEALYLGQTNIVSGPFPNVNRSTNIPLKQLDLSNISLSGSEVLDSIGHFKSLITLDLSSCGLVGSLPKSLANLRDLTHLDLSSNMLNGTLPSCLFTVPSLEYVSLSYNMFSGNLPLELFALQSLRELSLNNNQFEGQIDVLDQGPTLQTFRNLVNLDTLDLSFNKFSGDWELDTLLSSLINITYLDLSYSGLSIMNNNATNHVNTDVGRLRLAACNLTVFPGSIRAMKDLTFLDLSSNYIGGHIPHWVGEIGGLIYLNLSHNFIRSFPLFQWKQINFLHLKSNLMQGQFPPAICNMSQLFQLDISNNKFVGMIPQCFGNISSILSMVDMGNNHFHGTIPDVFEDCGKLEGLVLNGNQLEGELTSSLSKCHFLKVLDLGNNHLNGTFPNWLEDLPFLQVLVLKSNNMCGPIVTSSQVKLRRFRDLQVLDLSYNGFVGHLPRIYLQSFNAMRDRVSNYPKQQYLKISNLYYSIIVVVKGQELAFPQLFVEYTIINLSNNKFEGEIPDVIGGLTSLIVLDLSHNNLIGRIPDALGKILEIQSLDLSWNQLTGKIPQSLADLTFLEFLNLSENHLKGRIPAGRQFNTFEGNSYGGNPELCGLPLTKKCELPHEPEPRLVDDEDTESGFTWRVVMLGFGSGTLLGLVLGYIMLSTGKPKWFNAIADAGERMIHAKQNKRRNVYIGR